VKRFVNTCQLLLAMPPPPPVEGQFPLERHVVCFLAAVNEGQPYSHAAKLQPHVGDVDLAVISQPAMPRIQLRAAAGESSRRLGAHPSTILSKRPPVSNPMLEE
jgi:hypothetical protein